jgi:protein-tyrosine phosphatase
VLVVGTGNVCRSAYVERRLAHLLARAGVTVASAGTEAVAGAGMDGVVARRLGRARGSAEDFASRALTLDHVAEADLVLAVTRAHRAAVAQLHHPAVGYCFTLGDFADLVRGLPVADVEDAETPWVGAVAAAAAARRGYVATRRRREVDLYDACVGRPADVRRMARQVEKLLPPVVAALTPPVQSWAQRATLRLAGPGR